MDRREGILVAEAIGDDSNAESEMRRRAEQGARANAATCHDSCRARNRARQRRGSSLTLGASAPMRQITLREIQENEPRHPIGRMMQVQFVEFRQCSKNTLSIVRGASNARIGREILDGASGGPVSEIPIRSMAFARPPNKTPEPTPRPVTIPAEPGIAPGRVVAHL